MAKEGRFSGSFATGSKAVKVQLTIYSWSEDNVHFVYSPALDISGYGLTTGEAMESFTHVLGQTLDYMQKKNVLYDELERLGWLINRRKKRVQAPDTESMRRDNKDFARIERIPDVIVSDHATSLQLA